MARNLHPPTVPLRAFAGLLLVLVATSGCGITGPDESVTPVVDWGDRQYDWIGYYQESLVCVHTEYRWTFFFPKFSFEVWDISSGGDQLLISTYEGAKLYDLRSGRSRLVVSSNILHGRVRSAQWSFDGRQILVATYPDRQPERSLAIYTLATGSVEFPEIGELDAWRDVAWMPGDTSICAWIVPGGELLPIVVEIASRPPYERRVIGKVYQHFTVATGRVFCFEERNKNDRTGRGTVVVGRGSVDSGISGRSAILNGAAWITIPSEFFARAARNGRFAAIGMGADLAGTRFAQDAEWVPAVGVVDLRENSPTYLQLYRVLVDALGEVRICARWYDGRFAISPDGRYLYHTWIRMSDSTMQIARRTISSGEFALLTDFREPP